MAPLLKFAFLLFVVAILHTHTYAQGTVKILTAAEAKSQITIDGKLSEPAWEKAEKASGFIQAAPVAGEQSIRNTEVSILYDDDAVYIGAVLHDEPDSIMKQLTARDDYENSNTDAFGVLFDTYNDKQNATHFIVTSAGVQGDAIMKFDNVDWSWNAAWYSKVSMTSNGWIVEMKIPYSALRFSKQPVQQWGINFFRVIRRTREKSYWNKVDPAVQNAVGQEGILNGIHDIKSPVRLALLPYISGYGENYAGANAHSFNGGMDIKYGLNESFTLDMTLVPDFGQTLFDNKVLNLSPIEVRYDERRYFFTEGVSLFNKNDLFYSRRVGGTPVNINIPKTALDSNEVVEKNPLNTRLYNATKVSGRTRGNLGIGFFNAVSAPAYATIKDTLTNAGRQVQTSPLTNYNVIVLDQALKNNSYLSFVNTNVTRKENSYNADVSALLFKVADKQNKYGISGSAEASQLYYPTNTDVGYRYIAQVDKLSGNYTATLKLVSISDKFNPNDLGYLDRNNIQNIFFDNYYRTYKPKGIINSTYNHLGLGYYRIYNPDVYSNININGSHNLTFTSFHSVGVYWDAQPITGYDYLEPRTPGRYYQYPRNGMVGAFISSDYRKKFAIDLEWNDRWYADGNRSAYYWLFSPRFRFSNKFSTVYKLEKYFANAEVGFVDKVNDSIYLGRRNVNTVTNTLTANYIFTRTMSLALNARHYWSQAEYSDYYLLDNNGTLSSSAYNISHNINYNSFNVFLNFVWQFKPGSEMSVVYQNSIYYSGPDIITDYFRDANNTLQAPQSNSLSVKMIYYLDYQTMEKAFRKKRRSDS